MVPQIKKGGWWIDQATNMPHMVVSVDVEDVVTWSSPKLNGTGYSWMGSKTMFLQQFLPHGGDSNPASLAI